MGRAMRFNVDHDGASGQCAFCGRTSKITLRSEILGGGYQLHKICALCWQAIAEIWMEYGRRGQRA